jgi:hypothetical protein
MRALLSAKVSFYRMQLPAYAMLVHPGGAPGWVVNAWVRRVSRPRRRRAGLLPVERLLESDLGSKDAARKARREFLSLLGRARGKRKMARPETYE